MNISNNYLEPTPESGRAYFSHNITGAVVMLNLLRFRALADYSTAPELAPASPISGDDAYQRYMSHTLPHLRKSGGEMLFFGRGDHFLIGSTDERWDAVMLVQRASMAAFRQFASNRDYIAGMGHRIAALEDSLLLLLRNQTTATTP